MYISNFATVNICSSRLGILATVLNYSRSRCFRCQLFEGICMIDEYSTLKYSTQEISTCKIIFVAERRYE